MFFQIAKLHCSVVNIPFDVHPVTDDKITVVNVHHALAANDIMVSRPHYYYRKVSQGTVSGYVRIVLDFCDKK